MKDKIFERIDKMISENITNEDTLKVGNTIYDLCSMNKFYSKNFADLFAKLATKYQTWMMPIFDEKYINLMLQYNDIQYIDSEIDYDGFCEMNKKNEKRRAVTTFFMNLAIDGFITTDGIINILKQLLHSVENLMQSADKKNEVDELTENIAIMFNKDILDDITNDVDVSAELWGDVESINELVNRLAKTKAKDYPGLSNKAIFKFMDLVEM